MVHDSLLRTREAQRFKDRLDKRPSRKEENVPIPEAFDTIKNVSRIK